MWDTSLQIGESLFSYSRHKASVSMIQNGSAQLKDFVEPSRITLHAAPAKLVVTLEFSSVGHWDQKANH